jgi:hypothetical protein
MGNTTIIIQVLILANNRALRWSLASSVLSPFIRFWDSLTALQAAAVISALVLTVGAVIEYWDKLKLLVVLALRWILGKSTPFHRCIFKKLFIHSIGPIFVVLGIAGEVVFEGRTFIVEDEQEEQSQRIVGSLQVHAERADEKIGAAEGKADAASLTADKAQKASGAVLSQAEKLDLQLDSTNTQLDTVEARRAELEKSL